ncbi:MAG: tetratricopeptide repeat protein [Candidatus Hermodarchaeota archaeon]
MTKTTAKKLEEIEQLFSESKFSEALQNLDILGAQSHLTEEERLQCHLFKSKIYLYSGTKAETQLQLANEILLESQTLGQLPYIIEALFQKATVLWGSYGQLNEVEELLLQAEALLDPLLQQSDKTFEGAHNSKLVNLKADIFHRKGNLASSRNDFTQSIEYFEKSLELFEKTGNLDRISSCFNNLATLYGRKGDLNRGMEYFQKGLAFNLERNDTLGAVYSLSGIGSVHLKRGELSEALESFLQAYQYAINFELPPNIPLLTLGEVYWRMGEFEQAQEHLEQCLDSEMRGTVLPRYNVEGLLYRLVTVTLDQQDFQGANRFVERLRTFHAEEPNHLVQSQYYRVAQALIFKSSLRLRDSVHAEELLVQVLNEETVDHQIDYELMVEVILHLCDLRLTELRLTGSAEVLKEVQELLTRLRVIAQDSGSYWVLAETYVLQARLALVEMDLTEVRNLLTEAQIIAQKQQMRRLSQSIAQEYDLLVERLERWEEFVARKPSVGERADILQVEALVTRMIYTQGTNLEDPLIRAHVIAPESFAVNEEIRLAIDLVNIGRKPGLAMRIEQILPPRFTLIETQPEYISEGGSLLLEGKLLGPMQTTSISLRVRIDGSDSIQVNPQVVYANLQGEFEVSHTNPISMHSLLTFSSDQTQAVFDYLVDAFRQDNVRKNLRVEDSGWRIRTQILDALPQLNKWHFYGSHGEYGSILKELLQRNFVEVITETGKRSRKGRQIKIRIALEQEAVKQYVQRK